MPGADVDLSTKVRGPLLDGRASAVIARIVNDAAREIAQDARKQIKAAARGMDRSGRGGTGAAAAGVKLRTEDSTFRVTGGIRKGEFSWPWLEGTSERNQTTRFKGYGAFALARASAQADAQAVLERHAAQGLRQIGGS